MTRAAPSALSSAALFKTRLLSLALCSLALSSLALCLVGCEDPEPGSDADAPRDGSAPLDAATPMDSTVPTPDAGPIDCQTDVEAEGWSFCSADAATCEFVFRDSTGCAAACAELGLACVEALEDVDDMCMARDDLPALGCAPNGHVSDYCVCGRAAAPDAGPGDAGPDVDAGPDLDAGPSGPALAFPSARGAGAYATGGRGGRVIRVTTLANDGPGSLREALTASGPRIIVFAVSGTIPITSTIVVSEGDFTLAGQTAPAGGITLTGGSRVIEFREVSNFILRYLRVRPEYSSFDAVRFTDCDNFIADHMSVSFGGDEVMSSTRDTDDVTFQRTLFGEGKTGTLFGDSDDPALSENLSFHHNAYYNVTHRHPNMHSFGRVDHYNNVVFNWRFRWSVVIGDVQLNHMNNYYSQGCLTSPSGQNSFNKVFYRAAYEPELHSAGNLVMPSFFTDPAASNAPLWSWRVDVTEGPYAGAEANTPLTTDYFVDTPFALLGPPATVQSASAAFTDVTGNVGADARVTETGDVVAELDALDTLYLDNIRAGDCVSYMSSSAGQDFDSTPHYAAFRATISATPLATGPTDSDEDGMPDAWESSVGFDTSTDDSALDADGDGYTNIEEFINRVDG